jgi:hypothetical protein
LVNASEQDDRTVAADGHSRRPCHVIAAVLDRSEYGELQYLWVTDHLLGTRDEGDVLKATS